MPQPFIDAVAERLASDRREDAERVARVVLLGLHIQLPERAAKDLERSMPEELKALWAHRHEDLKLERGSSTQFARHQFIAWVADHAGVGDPYQAERAIRAVLGVLREHVPEADRVVQQELSEGIRELWAPEAQHRVAGAGAR